MKIGVISDTHLGLFGSGEDTRDISFRQAVTDKLAGAELFVHAGDVGSYALIEWLETLAPVVAVYGNMDEYATVSRLPQKNIFTAGRFSIGVTHGYGPPGGLLRYVEGEFEGEELDCLIFGHSHTPLCEKKGKILYFNPGSPTDKRFARCNSVGMLTVTDELKGEIIYL